VALVDVVDVVAVGDPLVAAVGSMHMAVIGVLHVREGVFVVVTPVRVVGVTLVDVVEVSFMLDGCVPASGSVLVGMIVVDGVLGGAHGCSLV
jgi:hypothetical protein